MLSERAGNEQPALRHEFGILLGVAPERSRSPSESFKQSKDSSGDSS
jgi:hypothetical protein